MALAHFCGAPASSRPQARLEDVERDKVIAEVRGQAGRREGRRNRLGHYAARGRIAPGMPVLVSLKLTSAHYTDHPRLTKGRCRSPAIPMWEFRMW